MKLSPSTLFRRLRLAWCAWQLSRLRRSRQYYLALYNVRFEENDRAGSEWSYMQLKSTGNAYDRVSKEIEFYEAELKALQGG